MPTHGQNVSLGQRSHGSGIGRLEKDVERPKGIKGGCIKPVWPWSAFPSLTDINFGKLDIALLMSASPATLDENITLESGLFNTTTRTFLA